MKVLARRTATLIAAGALAATTLAAPAEAAPKTPAEAKLGATWLSGQLTKGLIYNDQYDFDDYGLTVDVGLALDEVGGQKKKVAKVRKALEKNVTSYIGSGDELYAGSAAKVTVFAQATGGGAEDFGGEDLVARVRSTVTVDGPTAGRIADQSEFGDYANVIGQAYAVQALSAAGAAEAASARDFLLRQQCGKGYFRLYFSEPDAPEQGCSNAADDPDTDATALAILSLKSLDKKPKAVKQAIEKSVKWLKGQQRANGSFGGGTSTEAPNANSTGLAASALASAKECKPAKKAAGWVKGLQVGPKAKGKLRNARGAVAYNKAAKKQAAEDGIVVETRDQWRRTSAQAVPALLYVRGCR